MKLFRFILVFSLVCSINLTYAQGFDDEESFQVKVELYPNPVTEVLNIAIEGNIEGAQFTLHNIIGNRIDIVPEKVSNQLYKVNVNGLAPGYYLLMVQNDRNFRYTHKFLKR